MDQLRIDQQVTTRQRDEQAGTRIALRFLRDSLAWERRLATLRGDRDGHRRPAHGGVMLGRATLGHRRWVWLPGTPPGAGDRDTLEVGAGSDRAAW